MFVATGYPILLPPGTQKVKDYKTWAIYYNAALVCTWLAYAVPSGWQVMTLPGVYNVTYNTDYLRDYVNTRQAYACGECDEA